MRPQSQFTTVHTEGGLLPPDLLARVAEGDKSLEGLDPIDYHLAPGERLNEAISRSWNRLLGAWGNFTAALADAPDSDRTATALTRSRWSQVLFQELGYGQLQAIKALDVDGNAYPVSHLWSAVPIHLVGARVDLDRRTSGVAGATRVSPHGLVQELLNRSDKHLWGFLSNGLRLRLLRDNVSLTRQAYLEFDLEAMMTGQAYADFVVLWLVCHQSRVEGDIPEKCFLELWSAEAARHGTRALDRLRGAVESAIATMGQGFLAHPANGNLRDRLRAGDLDRQDYYRQLLRLAYRLIFVSVAEARDVLNDPAAGPTAIMRYRRFYSLERIRTLSETRRGGPHVDLWIDLQFVFRALGSDTGCPELALPALGSFLWGVDTTPDLDGARLANRCLLDALRVLSSTREGKVTRPVDYRNLGSEELGSIYESLLELHPQLNVDARTFSLSTAAGHERKTTGSYYTPASLIKELLDSALEPVLAEAGTRPDEEAALLDLKVLDPACGSGHFLIAAAHRIAKRLASVRTGDEEPSPNALRTALRDVVGRCLHGVDINPMAVELCKVSLWLEAIEPGKPLSFLDHRIVVGNSLLGTTPRRLVEGIPDDAFRPLTGDDKEIASALRKRNAVERKTSQQTTGLAVCVAALARALTTGIAVIDALPDDTAAALREKERRHAALVTSEAAELARMAADTWCAAFVLPKVKGAPVVTDAVFRRIISTPRSADSLVVNSVRRAAADYRFLHFHLAFPHVFRVPEAGTNAEHPSLGWDGGFDVVLGNPPWDRLKVQEVEWFSERAPDLIQASTAAERRRMIAELANSEPEMLADYKAAVRQADGWSHFIRRSGRYPLSGRGDVNTYGGFAESSLNAVKPFGRVGMIVPSGLATDFTMRDFFGELVSKQSLISLYEFENVGFFEAAGQGHMNRFCLLTLGGIAVKCASARVVFQGQAVQDIHNPDRVIMLSQEDLALLNPNTLTCPIFRTGRDAIITKDIYRRIPVFVLESPAENAWSVDFLPMFHSSNDFGPL